MDDRLRDVPQSLRVLLKERTFTAAVLPTLAVCIGANVAIYSVVRTVLLEPLPFDEPDQIVTVYNSYPGAGVPRAGNGSVDFFQRRANVQTFEEVAAFQGWGNTVGEAGSTDRVASLRVTPSFFPLLRVEAALGRTFTEDEMEVGNHQRVVLTHGYWQEHLGGAADVVGWDLRIDGRPFTVVGVLDEDFPTLFNQDARFLLPIPFSDQERQLDTWHSNNYGLIARLRDGASVEQATAQNQALNDVLRNGLVAGQVAIAFVMLIGAGLMLLSFPAALSVDPRFRPEGILTANVSLPDTRYEDGEARRLFRDESWPRCARCREWTAPP